VALPAELSEGESITLVAALVIGLVEGVTEFLPVSSTGHLIVAQELLSAQNKTLTVGIQVGAITAILLLYGRDVLAGLRTLPRARSSGAPNLLLQIAVAALPAAVLGVLLEKPITSLFGPMVVAVTTLAGGVLLLALESWLRRRGDRPQFERAQFSYRQALWIGCWQCLALVPGTSRSAATIAGAMLLGSSRGAAAEFSFLVGLPILYGAAGLKLEKNWHEVTGPLLVPFVVATVVAFLTALVIVRPFVSYVRSHSFVPFAIYRLAFGVLLLVGIASGWLHGDKA